MSLIEQRITAVKMESERLVRGYEKAAIEAEKDKEGYVIRKIIESRKAEHAEAVLYALREIKEWELSEGKKLPGSLFQSNSIEEAFAASLKVITQLLPLCEQSLHETNEA